jgi:hypothetical protein
MWNEKYYMGQEFFYPWGYRSAVMVIKSITDKMFYILKKYCCGGDDFVNIDATTEV